MVAAASRRTKIRNLLLPLRLRLCARMVRREGRPAGSDRQHKDDRTQHASESPHLHEQHPFPDARLTGPELTAAASGRLRAADLTDPTLCTKLALCKHCESLLTLRQPGPVGWASRAQEKTKALTTITAMAAAVRDPRNVDFTWTPTRPPFRFVTVEQAAAYDELGFFVVENAFSPEIVSEIVAEIDPFEHELEELLRQADGGRVFIARADEITFTTHLVALGAVTRSSPPRLSRHLR